MLGANLICAPLIPILFAGNALVAPGVVSTGASEANATLTPDGRNIYFARSDLAGEDITILTADLGEHGWEHVRIAPFSGAWNDSEPSISPDGRRLFFASNRPVVPGGASLTASMMGLQFPGTNLWYVEQTPEGWTDPIHIPGELNRVPMVYSPSVALSGNLYFSAHREDSGDLYQIYMARWNGHAFDSPILVDFAGSTYNHMDPAIDPSERFMLLSGNEGDSHGSWDIYISFRDDDGHWGKPINLGSQVNSRKFEIAPTLGRTFGQIFVTSDRGSVVAFPKTRLTVAQLAQKFSSAQNGTRDIWEFNIADVLIANGVRD